MSILDNVNNINPESPEYIANNLKDSAARTYQLILMMYKEGIEKFWNNPSASPTQICDALGNDAKEVFELHYKLGQFISNIKPEDINNINNSIGNFTINNDGTVTINKE